MPASEAVTQSPQRQHLVGRTALGPHQPQQVVTQLDSLCLSTEALINQWVAHRQPHNVEDRKYNVWSPGGSKGEIG